MPKPKSNRVEAKPSGIGPFGNRGSGIGLPGLLVDPIGIVGQNVVKLTYEEITWK